MRCRYGGSGPSKGLRKRPGTFCRGSGNNGLRFRTCYGYCSGGSPPRRGCGGGTGSGAENHACIRFRCAYTYRTRGAWARSRGAGRLRRLSRCFFAILIAVCLAFTRWTPATLSGPLSYTGTCMLVVRGSCFPAPITFFGALSRLCFCGSSSLTVCWRWSRFRASARTG